MQARGEFGCTTWGEGGGPRSVSSVVRAKKRARAALQGKVPRMLPSIGPDLNIEE